MDYIGAVQGTRLFDAKECAVSISAPERPCPSGGVYERIEAQGGVAYHPLFYVKDEMYYIIPNGAFWFQDAKTEESLHMRTG
ncbi:MAG: hypothetical protein ACLUOI_37715 [Eisenbergiella sp.]